MQGFKKMLARKELWALRDATSVKSNKIEFDKIMSKVRIDQ